MLTEDAVELLTSPLDLAGYKAAITEALYKGTKRNICGTKLRRHVRRCGHTALVPAWGCANRIVNGRAICDSHHVREDVLEKTYKAAVTALVEDAGSVIGSIKESAEDILQPRNKEALEQIEQQIIDTQEAVLELHKRKRDGLLSEERYKAEVNSCAEHLQALEAQRDELQSADTRYAQMRAWLAAFREHIETGDIMNDHDGSIMRSIVERIIVNDDCIEIEFKCGVSIKQEYVR